MTSLIPMSRSIPGGGPPLSFPTGMRNVPEGPGPEYKRKIKRTDGGSANAHTHLPNGEWTITVDAIVTPMPKLLYHTYINTGDLLWTNRVPRSGLQAKNSEIYVNHYCFNDLCRKGWRAAKVHLGKMIEMNRNTLTRNANGLIPGERRENMLNFLQKPESQWTPLFADDSTLLAKNDGLIMLHWLCKEGIMRRYNCIGTVVTPPAIQYGVTEIPRTKSRMQMAWAMEGISYVPNIWGKRACHGAYLFEILKRDAITGTWENFASIPYANISKTVPSEELEYIGVSGNMEVGIAIYRGRVIEVLGTPAEGEELEIIQGRRGSVENSRDACNHAAKLKIMQASPHRIS